MKQFEWVAEGANVYMLDNGVKTPFCKLSSDLLTPSVAAKEVADALNDKFTK